jgi:hypothetical protein
MSSRAVAANLASNTSRVPCRAAEDQPGWVWSRSSPVGLATQSGRVNVSVERIEIDADAIVDPHR